MKREELLAALSTKTARDQTGLQCVHKILPFRSATNIIVLPNHSARSPDVTASHIRNYVHCRPTQTEQKRRGRVNSARLAPRTPSKLINGMGKQTIALRLLVRFLKKASQNFDNQGGSPSYATFNGTACEDRSVRSSYLATNKSFHQVTHAFEIKQV